MRTMGGGGTLRRSPANHPQTVGASMVNATFQVADAILLGAAVHHLGLGNVPPDNN